jgi:predicted alpha/beta hydrolase
MTDTFTQRLTTPDGVRLALHRLGDKSDVPVLLVPGTFSNHTFWLDTRGHGASQRPGRADQWDFDDWAREDIPTALRALLSERRRPFVIGHSAGGAAVLAGLAANPELCRGLRGIVIVATPLPWLQPWRAFGARLIRLASQLIGRFPARLLKLGPEDELAGVMTQWMTWNTSGRWLGDDGTDYAAGLAQLELPLLTVAGTGDHFFAPPRACHGLHELISSPDKTFVLCGRHSGYGEDLNHVSIMVGSVARARVWPLINLWLQQRT